MARKSTQKSDKKPARAAPPAKEGNDKEEHRQGKSKRNLLIAAVILAIVIVVGIMGTAMLGQPGTNTNFNVFKGNFDSASNVSIIVGDFNSSAYSQEISCAVNLVEIVVGSQQYHKNASAIGFYVMNQTSCTYEKNGIGGLIGNYTNTTASDCLNRATRYPTVYINYSATNITRISPNFLYLSGNQNFLTQCGITSEIS